MLGSFCHLLEMMYIMDNAFLDFSSSRNIQTFNTVKQNVSRLMQKTKKSIVGLLKMGKMNLLWTLTTLSFLLEPVLIHSILLVWKSIVIS